MTIKSDEKRKRSESIANLRCLN